MTRVARRHAATRVPSTRTTTKPATPVVESPPRDFRTLPVGMRQRATNNDTAVTAVLPVVGQTLIIPVTRDEPAQAVPLPDRKAPDPSDISLSGRSSWLPLYFRMPRRTTTYQGGNADLPERSWWDRQHDTDDWADQTVTPARHGRPVVKERPADDQPVDLDALQERVIAALLPDRSVQMRQADKAARANDIRLDTFAKKFEDWASQFSRDLEATGSASVKSAAATDVTRLAYGHAGQNTVVSGMLEAAKMRADLDAMLAADSVVSA